MNLSPYQAAVAAFANEFYTKARPNQIVDETEDFKWHGWLCGRGFGKTWALNSNCFLKAALHANTKGVIIAPTHGDLKKITLDGESGLKTIIPTQCLRGGSWKDALRISDGELYLANSSMIYLMYATEPDRIRGLNISWAGLEEFAAYGKNIDSVLYNLRFAMRSKIGGENIKSRIYFSTTPRPLPAIKEIIKRADAKIIRGRTVENKANLSDNFYEDLQKDYEGTRIGRQELEGEILEDIEGALWTGKMIDDCHMAVGDELPIMKRVIVGVDPSGKGNEAGDYQGIVVCGLGEDGIYYVIDDVTCSLSPDGWATQAVQAYYKYSANRIVAESNFGGDMVKSVIRNVDARVPYTAVTASRGKHIRAEPVATLYEQGKVKHIKGLGALESQMLEMSNMGFKGKGSPDRLDALVWAMTELMPSNKYIAYGGGNS